jgi:hypothetical protein
MWPCNAPFSFSTSGSSRAVPLKRRVLRMPSRDVCDTVHQVKARVPRAEKKAEEWPAAAHGGARASSAPAKPDLDDDELKVADAWRATRGVNCAAHNTLHCRPDAFCSFPYSACAISVRACKTQPLPSFSHVLFFASFSDRSRLNLRILLCKFLIAFCRRELVANLGGGSGSSARKPQLQ